MSKSRSPLPAPPPHAGAASPSLHRSGAVARMLRMPVATLRVWERRYGVTQPALSASGQRLYANEDVRRLALIKQLRDLGHAIGSLAALNMAQLQQVASTHADAAAGGLASTQAGLGSPAATPPGARSPAQPATASPPWRLAVIGTALGARLRRPAVLQRLGQFGQPGPLARPVAVLGPFADIAQAAAALGPGADGAPAVDALLIHEPQLQAGWWATLQATAPAFAALPKAVLYGFAAEPVCEALAAAGTALLREPQSDTVLVQWLQGLCAVASWQRPVAAALAQIDQPEPPAPSRRWDEAALTEFAGLSSTVACECPRHLAELLMQLSHFEAYSATCEHRHAADAEFHAYLRQVAASSRSRFEDALARVALHEGLMLP